MQQGHVVKLCPLWCHAVAIGVVADLVSTRVGIVATVLLVDRPGRVVGGTRGHRSSRHVVRWSSVRLRGWRQTPRAHTSR
jgi:hypothetical protein